MFIVSKLLQDGQKLAIEFCRLQNMKQTVTIAYVVVSASLVKAGKALTWGRTDHFVTYLQFSIMVCFSTAETERLFRVSLSLWPKTEIFSCCDLELWPI